MESGGNSNNISWTTNPLVFVMYILGILLLRFALGLAAIPLFTDQDQDAHVAWTATHVVHAFVSFHLMQRGRTRLGPSLLSSKGLPSRLALPIDVRIDTS